MIFCLYNEKKKSLPYSFYFYSVLNSIVKQMDFFLYKKDNN